MSTFTVIKTADSARDVSVVCNGIFSSGTQETGAIKITGTSLFSYNNYVNSVTIGGTGTGYTYGDPLIFTGGGGTGAAGFIETNSSGNIVRVILTNVGSGYTSAPSVAVTTSGGSGNTLTAVVPLPTPILGLRKAIFSITTGCSVEVIFDGVSPQTACVLTGTGELDFDQNGMSIANGATTPNGNVLFTTTGFASGGSYTVGLAFNKLSGF